jgi:hypothetical protein
MPYGTYRNRSTRRRQARHAAVLALAFAMAAAALTRPAPAAPAGDNGAYQIALHADAAARAAPTLSIHGNWPTPCTPTFESARLDGADLRVDARATLSLCAQQATPYSIEVNAPAALGLATLKPGVFHVSFYAANGTQAEPKLRAFALVDSASRAPDFAPETGFWWTSSGAAAGRSVLSLERQGTQLTAALMTYDHDGRGNWQFGTAQMHGRIAHVPLLQLAGGSDLFAAAASPPRGEPGLMLDLEFHSSSQATAWLSRPATGADVALQLQSLELVRMPFAETGNGAAWKGDWVLVTDADQFPPLRLRFDRVTVLDAYRFRLSDDYVGVVLDCESAVQDAGATPRHCTAQRIDGSDLGRLDAVAMTRMDGARGDGIPVHLLRISP